MAYWLLKTEPDAYSFADLEREGSTVWDGVTNNVALKHMRVVKAGDLALVYHTGDERQAVGLAEITSNPYPDPRQNDPKLIVFDLRPLRRLPRPVALAQVKADARFANFELVRQARLSVMPVNQPYRALFLALAGEE